MSLKDFESIYSILHKNNINLTIYPKIWNKNLFCPYNTYSKKLYLFENNGIIENISNYEIPDYKQDIIVYTTIGDRSYIYIVYLDSR